jgi:hypothetical protein
MINLPSVSADARNRPSGENDKESTTPECCLRILSSFSFASGVQMRILPLSIPLNKNEITELELKKKSHNQPPPCMSSHSPTLLIQFPFHLVFKPI